MVSLTPPFEVALPVRRCPERVFVFEASPVVGRLAEATEAPEAEDETAFAVTVELDVYIWSR